ncbi:undecaprenyl-phosphate glucose phosphotransferase [Burkholderia vietnamiensis]|uniref:undecaprenyl-phosphate glucose phosphotransferase n=1 Tax=Burkholderia vietnamiensis TaxID=60552 RepID=UPI00075B31BF|nr:undecaprenyl-phosphate glucose phosphotransferase [Burkholderia vietnamiensis]KVE79318.1 undecaprenyl-phosphate glucose phosphotransferase [Burkholderia vietnamiensis]HDR9202350.1 undecaprenyl-phosphate glucose phosphotransferase [Burkholderia vietnamiensis]
MFGVQSMVARVLDAAVVVAAAAVASHVRFADDTLGRSDAMVVPFVVMLTLAVFPALQVYQSWRGRSWIAMISRISAAWIAVQACNLVLLFALHRADQVSRLWFAYWTGIAGCGFIAMRMLAYAMLARVRHAGLNLRKVAIVGSGAYAVRVIETLALSPASGFRPVLFHDPAGASDGVLPAITDFAAFAAAVRAEAATEIWLAVPICEERTIRRVLKAFGDDLVNIRFMPDMRSIAWLGGTMMDLVGMPAINLVASPMSHRALLQKALFDRVFAAAALVALAPLLGAIAVAVKLSSPGPVLFTQYRKGADGRVFRIYKFRTMRVHADPAGVVRQATRGDARITRVGAFLRRTSLDELPQFFNVLRGDMSVVGPRPHAIEHDDLYRPLVDGYIHRYRIKPGITGWAQVNGYRGETDQLDKMVGRVQHDLYYLRNWSFGLDMRIVAATVLKGFVHPNAY